MYSDGRYQNIGIAFHYYSQQHQNLRNVKKANETDWARYAVCTLRTTPEPPTQILPPLILLVAIATTVTLRYCTEIKRRTTSWNAYFSFPYAEVCHMYSIIGNHDYQEAITS